MKLKYITPLALSLAAACVSAHADSVVTKDGATLTGQITLIDDGIIHLSTAYAGDIKIHQDQVSSFSTSAPLNLRLESGSTYAGAINTPDTPDYVEIQTESERVNANIASIADSWGLGAEDPEVKRERELAESLERKWSIETAFNLSGKSGNTDESDYGANFDATLKGPTDEFNIYASYLYGETNDARTDDEMELGASYDQYQEDTSLFGWYVSSMMRRDTMEDIDFRSRSSAGVAMRLINNDRQTLRLRMGPGYIYTSYSGDKDNDSGATANASLKHTYKFNQLLSMKNSLSYATQLDDTGDYEFIHDSSLVIPIGNGESWKVSMGITNEYDSQPAVEEKWDTTYYTKMVYTWK
jgi:putative salt-induced outer membrane protein YdiY